jgi:hypothetical protein
MVVCHVMHAAVESLSMTLHCFSAAQSAAMDLVTGLLCGGCFVACSITSIYLHHSYCFCWLLSLRVKADPT